VPAFNAELARYAALDAQVLSVSIDPIPCHVAWQKKDIGMMNFPLCSDFYPHGGLARQYGILREGPPIPGINERAVFVIDKQGRIVFSKVYPLDETPEQPELLEVVRKLNESQAAAD
jgi:alkyl hydroperoxide reductase subunit AhpC